MVTPSYLTLRAEVRRRRELAGLSRERVVEVLAKLPGCPERLLDPVRVRRLETSIGTTPDDLTELRFLVAAVGWTWEAALAMIGGWPPVEG